MKLTQLTCLTVLIGLVSITTAGAQIIGVNFQGDDTNPLAPADSAGAISSTNWNNLLPNSGTVTAPTFVDSTNTHTTLTLSYTSNYNVGGTPGTSDPFNNLYANHIESPYSVADSDTFTQAIATNNRVTLSLSAIPYTTYNLYVYTSNQPGTIYVSSSASTVINTASSLTYTNANPNGENYIAGDNYVEFTGLTSSTLFLYAGNPSVNDAAGFNSGIAGFQIVNEAVSAPEPSTYALMVTGLGLLALMARRRRTF